MSLPPIGLSRIASLALLAVLCLSVRSDVIPQTPGSLRMRDVPHHILWAWERAEDLRTIDPATTAVAYLDQTVLIGSEVVSKPRRQPLALPASARKIAVVRIEATPNADVAHAEPETVALLLRSAMTPGIAAFQVDFDATRSQRHFYRNVLRDLRAQMPPDLPLSMTALASWCSYDDWLRELPVDEAVPMMFRMEPDRKRQRAESSQLQIREPLCRESVGISTREAWPDDIAGKRIYIFPDRGWTRDIPLLAERNLP